MKKNIMRVSVDGYDQQWVSSLDLGCKVRYTQHGVSEEGRVVAIRAVFFNEMNTNEPTVQFQYIVAPMFEGVWIGADSLEVNE